MILLIIVGVVFVCVLAFITFVLLSPPPQEREEED
jgi:flagellar basal body-associated protein FliL